MKNSIITAWKRASALKSRKTIVGLSTTAINVRLSKPRGKHHCNRRRWCADFNCEEQRVAIKCGRGEINRSASIIGHHLNWEVELKKLKKKRKREKGIQEKFIIRSSENIEKNIGEREKRWGKGEGECADSEEGRERERHLCSLPDEKCYSLRKNKRKRWEWKKIKERDEKKDDHDGGWGRESFLRGYLQGDRE